MVELAPQISTDRSHGIHILPQSAMWALKTLQLCSCTIGQTLVLVMCKKAWHITIAKLASLVNNALGSLNKAWGSLKKALSCGKIKSQTVSRHLACSSWPISSRFCSRLITVGQKYGINSIKWQFFFFPYWNQNLEGVIVFQMIALGLTRRKPPGHSLPHPVIRSVQNMLVLLKSQLSEKLRPPLLHASAGECSPSNIHFLTQ